jgi:hypothetical protein
MNILMVVVLKFSAESLSILGIICSSARYKNSSPQGMLYSSHQSGPQVRDYLFQKGPTPAVLADPSSRQWFLML